MKCPLCGHSKTHKHGKISKGSQRYFCRACQQSFTDSFDTLYYRRQVTPEQVRTVLQSHSEGSSLRCISRITGLAYNTIVDIVQAASQRAQLVHNAQVQQVATEEVSADEMWGHLDVLADTTSRSPKKSTAHQEN